MKTLSVASQKGGVGKSTETVHLAYAALEAGLRVLLVDMDVQGNSSTMFNAPEGVANGLVASQLFDEVINEAMPQVVSEKLSVIRADIGLTAYMGLTDKNAGWLTSVKRPVKALQRFKADYDLCLIDCPPSLGAQLMSALTASDFVLTPIAMGKFEIDGVNELMATIHKIRTEGLNPRLQHLGWLPSKINGRSNIEKLSLEQLRAVFGAAILPHVLMERAAVKTAILNNIPVWEKVKGSSHKKAAQEWQIACNYILNEVLK